MHMPINEGRLSRGAARAMMVIAPFNKPDDPRPATARPTMSIFDEVATAQSREPSSKTNRKIKNTHYYKTAAVSTPERHTDYASIRLIVPWSCSRCKTCPQGVEVQRCGLSAKLRQMDSLLMRLSRT